MKIGSGLRQLIGDYEHRNFLTSAASFAVTSLFLGYNFVIGILYRSVWNFSISFYYLFLAGMRGIIIGCEKQWWYVDEEKRRAKREGLYRIVTRLLFLGDAALVVPISLLVLAQRVVTMGMIPAIAVAAYTTYKVTASIVGFRRASQQDNRSLHSLKIIGLKDAMVSVLTLQNTMVAVFGDGKSMLMLTAYTSAAMLMGMIAVTAVMVRSGRKNSV